VRCSAGKVDGPSRRFEDIAVDLISELEGKDLEEGLGHRGGCLGSWKTVLVECCVCSCWNRNWNT